MIPKCDLHAVGDGVTALLSPDLAVLVTSPIEGALWLTTGMDLAVCEVLDWTGGPDDAFVDVTTGLVVLAVLTGSRPGAVPYLFPVTGWEATDLLPTTGGGTADFTPAWVDDWPAGWGVGGALCRALTSCWEPERRGKASCRLGPGGLALMGGGQEAWTFTAGLGATAGGVDSLGVRAEWWRGGGWVELTGTLTLWPAIRKGNTVDHIHIKIKCSTNTVISKSH